MGIRTWQRPVEPGPMTSDSDVVLPTILSNANEATVSAEMSPDAAFNEVLDMAHGSPALRWPGGKSAYTGELTAAWVLNHNLGCAVAVGYGKTGYSRRNDL